MVSNILFSIPLPQSILARSDVADDQVEAAETVQIFTLLITAIIPEVWGKDLAGKLSVIFHWLSAFKSIKPYN